MGSNTNNPKLMKKLLILVFAPLLMATQCNEDMDPIFATEFYIQNNASVDILYLTQDAQEVLIKPNSRKSIAFDTNTTESSILPSENSIFNSVTLFKSDGNGTMINAYEQDPINNELWVLHDSGSLDFEYTLYITNYLIE